MGFIVPPDSNAPPPPPPRRPDNLGAAYLTGSDDAANRIAADTATRQAGFRAATSMGTTGPMGPLVTRYDAWSRFLDTGVLSTHTPPPQMEVVTFAAPDAARRFESRLSERPADIRDATRSLVAAINDQIEQLNASMPNDESLTIHNDFVTFLEMIADGLSKLADALDLALGDDATKPVEPMFLGTAGKIVEKLKSGLFEYLDKEGANLAGFSIKIGLVAAGYKFLHACGVEGDVAAIVSGILGLKKK